ncbi:LTA synthase family protein [Pradoshia sp.]
MNKSFWPRKVSLMTLAIVLLWLKTYIVYKTSLDIKIENWRQEFILFINPLSFLMLIFGIALFLHHRRNQFILLTSFLLSFILFANIVFFRFFNDFLTLPVLFQASNMSDLGSSVHELLNWTDSLYFLDFFLLMIIIKYRPYFLKEDELYTKNGRRVYYLAALAITFLNFGLSEAERPQLLTRTFDREILVKNIGTYHYHLYDLILQTKSSAQRALADSSKLIDIENYVQSKQTEPDKELFGRYKGMNVIYISMESLQTFPIGATINGREVTPFLNDFIEESYYFDNFYHQTGQGKTSDAEFITENSLYPIGRGAVYFTNAQNTYRATPKILKAEGYYSAVFHANDRTFWNRDIMYDNFGYDEFFDVSSYTVNEENTVNWGLKDIDFFKQSMPMLKDLPEPFYAKFITLTNHFPFTLDEEDMMVDLYDSDSKTLNRYFPAVRYMDEALKIFVQDLKESGLYDRSVIVLYGDHYGISENHNAEMAEYIGTDMTPFQSTQLQRVPLIIHLPGQTGGKTISNVAAQIDLRPTIMHLLGVDTSDQIQFGADLFSPSRMNMAILRDGSFITDDYVYTKETCYSKVTGNPIDHSACELFAERAKMELDYSDRIIYGDLLRFYGNK